MARLIILSGPSGSGKSTIVQRLLERGDLPLRQSISATTRPPREGEQDGVHYHFWDRRRFEEGIAADEFLEHATVGGGLYGTPKSEVFPYLERGQAVVMVIDVQGAEQVRQKCPDCVTVFLKTTTMGELEQRLRGRGTETEADIQRRLANAIKELARAGEYQYQVINDDLDDAVKRLHEIIQSILTTDPSRRSEA